MPTVDGAQSFTLEALASWHEFYALLGGASATMTGLLFVAASVTSGIFSPGRNAALRVFLSASVVHFAGILAVCLIALAPIRNSALFSLMIAGCGGFGLAYHGVAWRDLVRGGRIASVDWEDRIWYAVLPVIGYLSETGAGVGLAMHVDLGCAILALALGILLVVAIHNAWDMTVWSITRRKE
ncbi:hypothetical protein [Limobrevibacterium gyesilva]|uniref:Uncharacterized protein n=1 Tax=Limobrevibacterium gyesilva TaxID=2991712 RepID=A0AA41YPL3_9PROT|nr:hypothetical protein [Limobrevibacterium gyesilva]MCW3476565.1 hypothetical protein [Limobrevibacterium gyesilva]